MLEQHNDKQGLKMATCIVQGCNNHATNNFGVRLRREDTTAIWAPNTEAYLCDAHAGTGFIVDVRLTPVHENQVCTRVSYNGGTMAIRTTQINHQP